MANAEDLRDGFGVWYRVEPSTGCWIWLRGKTSARRGSPRKYGAIDINGVTKRAHRVMYSLFKGPIPKGMFVCHKCDTPLCVNPEHLFIGTNADNMKDMTRKGRSARGELNNTTKLTEEDVHDIRRRLKNGETGASIGRLYGVHGNSISYIKVGRNWGWLEEKE